jgi:iron complex transport system permease protein
MILRRRGNLPLPVALGGLAVVLAMTALASLSLGSVNLTPSELMAVLGGGGEPLHRTLVLELRLPRMLTALSVGGLLALAGALMQVLLRNPLADPYILGVSGGAAVGALLTLMAGLGGLWIGGSAFAGALASTLLVFVLAHGQGGWTPIRLLLTGVVVAAGWGAVIGLILSLGDDSSLRSMLFWLMGDLSYADFHWAGLLMLGCGVLVCLPFARSLNVLARGELQAGALGVPVRALHGGIYLAGSLFTAVAVTQAGTISFVGLVVPHVLRLAIGADHRLLIPGSALLGGAMLILADTVARTALAPRQLPVGVVTAMVGVPLFLYLLNRQKVR